MLDRDLFAAIAEEAERRVSQFSSQGLANTAWAFATLNLLDTKLFMVLGRDAVQRVSQFES